MKKKISLFILAFGVSVLLSSCFNIPKTYKTFLDTNFPAERSTTITFKGGISVKEWNGNVVFAGGTVVLPAGDTSLLFDVRFTYSNRYSSTTYNLPNIEMKWNFEPGKKYEIRTEDKLLGLFKGYEFFIELYDTTKGTKLLKSWSIGKSN